jgi:hypothetical protein
MSTPMGTVYNDFTIFPRDRLSWLVWWVSVTENG